MSQSPASRADTAKGKERSGYASPSIKARRLRILSETRKIISEQGIAGVAMEDVAQRAGVAKRTIYNAFQSKERMIAAAIQQYFDEYAEHLTYHTEEATVDWMIERLAVVARRNLKIRNYSRALMNIYFTHEVDPEIQQAIYAIAADSHEPWVRNLHSKRQLQPWIDPDELIMALVALRYSIAFSWVEGQIPDDQFIIVLTRSFLVHMAGATRGMARKAIDQRLSNLEENPYILGTQ
ncbi:hypothetical protein MB02_10035 [Croceicoccus estronivorus]|uniref:TetR/AcrR family transcriptional regulator n=1 Tax=Croceicoccus estronivorus TaxID=1172626 RepID=UPI00082BE0C6|nr:TetR/AcrR family transcriptional regulator [Croceicoccus estronivorus]OCC23519.1 hypothetical protein MB02_10035 [Croceicoccus estronivorus]